MPAQHAVQLIHDLRGAFTQHGDRLHKQSRGIHGILAGDMPPDCQAAGGFAAQHGIRLLQLL
ncbi:hypothetical protein SDC9_202662 [bioreactor metagenome]|uniref:Uncharacterized protein n=1 Tax=bioreactor metagenome TaxID=1076179 RepID=A0A645J687_9ZZZZ